MFPFEPERPYNKSFNSNHILNMNNLYKFSLLVILFNIVYMIGYTIGLAQSSLFHTCNCTDIAKEDYIRGVKDCFVEEQLASIKTPNVCESEVTDHWWLADDEFNETDYYKNSVDYNNGYNACSSDVDIKDIKFEEQYLIEE